MSKFNPFSWLFSPSKDQKDREDYEKLRDDIISRQRELFELFQPGDRLQYLSIIMMVRNHTFDKRLLTAELHCVYTDNNNVLRTHIFIRSDLETLKAFNPEKHKENTLTTNHKTRGKPHV